MPARHRRTVARLATAGLAGALLAAGLPAGAAADDLTKGEGPGPTGGPGRS